MGSRHDLYIPRASERRHVEAAVSSKNQDITL
jgi:hypothetical protein